MQSLSNILAAIVPTVVVLLVVIGLVIWLRSRGDKSNSRRSARRQRAAPTAKDRQRVAVGKYVKHVGPELRNRYGNQQKYTPAQVKQAVKASGYSSQDDCYAFALYCSEDDFGDYHRSIGESCDYNSMRHEISDSFGFIFPSGTTFDATEVIDNSDRIGNLEATTDSGSSWFSLGDFGGGSSIDTGSSDYSSSDSGGSDGGGGDGGGGD